MRSFPLPSDVLLSIGMRLESGRSVYSLRSLPFRLFQPLRHFLVVVAVARQPAAVLCQR